MNCQNFGTIVSDLAREKMIDASLREEAMDHQKSCENCAELSEEQRRLTTALRDLGEHVRFEEASERVEKTVIALFRERQSRASQHRVRYLNYRVAAIAAMLLMIFGIVMMWSLIKRSFQPRSQRDETVQEQASPSPDSEKVAVKEKSVDRVTERVAPKRRRFSPNRTNRAMAFRTRQRSLREQTVAQNLDTGANEIATEFMLVNNMSTLNVQDGGRIVRVKLPRSAMARFGFPVNIDRANEPVKADVLFGIDGLAQAIRFIQ